VANGTPDQCRLHIALNQIAETAADALAATANMAAKAIATLGEIEIERCEVRTVGLSLQDFFDQSKQQVTARIGSYQMDLIIRPIDAAGDVLAALSSAVGDAYRSEGST